MIAYRGPDSTYNYVFRAKGYFHVTKSRDADFRDMDKNYNKTVEWRFEET